MMLTLIKLMIVFLTDRLLLILISNRGCGKATRLL